MSTSSPALSIDHIASLFPAHFRWGVATSSYQIEGAVKTDGRGKSIWDTFCETPGKVVNQESGAIACDHFNRFKSDFQLMRDLGIQTYRFSIAWPRLFPKGDDVRESRGFDFYNELIDSMLEVGIEPLATLYHWDLPQTLQDHGGWANRDIVQQFSHYAENAVVAFGDRITSWVTLNEPWCTTWLGYMSGVHAPGIQDLSQALSAAHHTALAHAEATRAIKAIAPQAKTGLALNMTNYIVDDPTNEELVTLAGLMDSHINRWWTEATLHGRYPENLVQHYGDKLEKIVKENDDALLKVENDFLGVNYYSDSFVSTPSENDGPISDGGLFPFPQRTGNYVPEPKTDMGWPVTPEGLGNLVRRIHNDWPEIPVILITENGAAYGDIPSAEGAIGDDRRVDYIQSHLLSLGEAVAEGVPVSTYFAWSFMDNFEWAEGYAKRFGIVHVDFQTLARTPKASAHYYSALIASHAQMEQTGN